MFSELTTSLVLALGLFAGMSSGATDTPDCCAEGAECCGKEAACCEAPVGDNAVTEPVCCDEPSECCAAQGECC